MYSKEKRVTIKVKEFDHEKLRRIKHERYLKSYSDVISELIEEHEKSHCVEAPV